MPPFRTSDNPSACIALKKDLRVPDFSAAGMQRLTEYFLKFPRNPDFVNRFPERFSSSNVAWMAGGMWDDGNNTDPMDSFHSLHSICLNGSANDEEFNEARKTLLKTVLNVTTAMDRVSGSTTLLLHFDPNDLSQVTRGPEGINPEVYITPHLRKDIKNANVAIARIVQMFIEGLAVPSLLRWERIMNASESERKAIELVAVRAELEAKNKQIKQQKMKIAEQKTKIAKQKEENREQQSELCTALERITALSALINDLQLERHVLDMFRGLHERELATVKQFKLPPVIHRRLFELYNSQVNALWFEDLIADGGITVKAAAALVRAMHEDLDMMFDETLCIQNVSQ
ncbi:hypothetical protein EW026_g3226 [Hermanssonia centrifuga]|uniref:Uncharacterized protein n=1 Tax=Hermanssonia centrifuga TaxID=98765 RepID=A0A4S4KLD6_9APHY|nr:hypothetical protein EW026_g3226 [Hermanssonia centrifuga]